MELIPWWDSPMNNRWYAKEKKINPRWESRKKINKLEKRRRKLNEKEKHKRNRDRALK